MTNKCENRQMKGMQWKNLAKMKKNNHEEQKYTARYIFVSLQPADITLLF
jgi:hypothetical protein